AAIVLVAASPATAQRRGAGAGGLGVYKSQLTPHWFDGGSKFWYRNDLVGGKREFILVDAKQGQRERAFDHEKLAAALKVAGVDEAAADRLPIDALEFKSAERAVEFRAGNRDWRCDLAIYALIELKDRPAPTENRPADADRTSNRASRATGAETELTFVNRTAGEVEIFWLNTEGQRQTYGKIAAGDRKSQHTYAGHVWDVVSSDGRTLATIEAETVATTIQIDGRAAQPAIGAGRGNTPQRGFGGGRGGRGGSSRSPDGKWTASIKDSNVVIRDGESDKEIPLSKDGRDGRAYGMLDWSPDSKTLVAFRIEPGEQKEVHLIETSPRGGGRAVLHSRPYALPGDRFTAYELHVFNVPDQKEIKCEVDRIDFGTPRIRWNNDGDSFTYQQVDRGHQRLRLIEVNARHGGSRYLIDEKTDTFIWTAHAESVNLRPFNWLEKTDELIYVSERDGWRHLYVVDAKEGAIKNQITKGDFVVRGIERIDEENRQIWFRACGRNPDQDPYFVHFYRVNFDGTGLVALTAGNGTHTVQFSPDNQYLIDTYSRVDQPPIHELRRASDGQLICKLEEADITELKSRDWEAPEVFTAKGRDGQTDIWGIICRPKGFDPAKRYPVIEQIYAGPQGSFVPKSFSAQQRFSALTDLGFIVVQMDGMGTANRSKAFHDVCWKKLKDAGLPDRILWHKAVAAKYPWYDISRVGIYGGSAGGQNSTAALLFHPDFYKVGVSGCGCHDNRMDKASWNEQWMGYPVGPQYAECSNLENASKLRGKLMLIVGEMDTNVPTESTFRLADALIKAGKDFDLVVVPGAGHGMGGTYGTRRMHDFFVRHLLGQEPPDRNGDKGM
ncbi:MAG TPA: prolyl oligopeptidase family serine peptidase, partial [Pirellulaceae bacterium]|nr:prolyl oligopeptidase family serine peptidase [Pirellulaceae bacterium]